jgi:hypothetical protein
LFQDESIEEPTEIDDANNGDMHGDDITMNVTAAVPSLSDLVAEVTMLTAYLRAST